MTDDTSKEEMIYILKPVFFRSAPCNLNQFYSFLGRVPVQGYARHCVFKSGAVVRINQQLISCKGVLSSHFSWQLAAAVLQVIISIYLWDTAFAF